ncbi:MAG TPA: SIMPL domain-containing protein [Vicinamibacterales bacterium]|nr:SIMPL domain-containing protein [Vicinamibacterales bacterium]
MLLLALVLAAGRAGAQTETPEGSTDRDRRVIATQGRATVRRAPDRAFLVLATETNAPQPADAQKRNAELMTSVQEKLKGQLPPDAIRTLSYSIQEEFDFAEGRRVSRGYRVSNAIEVRVDDLSRLGALIDLAVGSGATTVSHIRFDLKDREAVEREALKQAVANAWGRAQAAAAGANLELDGVLRIEEHGAPVPLPVMQRTMAMESRAADTPIQPGEIEIEAAVTLTAGIR